MARNKTNSTAVSETVETNAPTETETGFDYSLVDDDTAQYLRKATARIANSYADIGAVLAEAQERLANNYHGVFEKWYISLGMARQTVYRFIQIHNFRSEMIKSSQFGRTSGDELEIFDNLPKTLQSDISSPSAPTEAVNAVLSGDITTHKDFVAMKKQLEEEQRKNKSLTEDIENLKIDNERLEDENGELTGENTDLEEERDKLLAELKEVKSEPKATVTIKADPKQSDEYKTLEERYDLLDDAYAEQKEKISQLSHEKRELEEQLHKKTGQLNYEEMERRITEAAIAANNEAVERIAQDRKNSAELLRERTEGMQARIDDLEKKLETSGIRSRYIITADENEFRTFLVNLKAVPKFSRWMSMFEEAVKIEL